jgi:DNA topoisomerase-3
MWEKELARIEKGDITADTFKKDIEVYTKKITTELLQAEIKSIPSAMLQCPKCKKQSAQVLAKVVKCTSGGCEWLLFRTVCGKILTTKAVQVLLEKGKSPLLKGLKSKTNNTFEAYLVLGLEGTTVFEFPVKKRK